MIFQKTDDQLIKMVSDGDSSAFKSLYDRHSSRIFGYCCRFLANKQKGEEAAQEVWMKILAASSRYKPEQKFLSWALTIARTTCLSELRDKSGSFEVELENNLEVEMAQMDLESVQKQLEETANLEILKKEIEALPDQQRAVLVIWMTHESSYEDIASEMNLSVSAVKSLLFRAKQTLEKNLRGRQ